MQQIRQAWDYSVHGQSFKGTVYVIWRDTPIEFPIHNPILISNNCDILIKSSCASINISFVRCYKRAFVNLIWHFMKAYLQLRSLSL